MKEWKAIPKSNTFIIVMIELLWFSSLYYFLSSMWDPYGQEVSDLPVAVISKDQSAIMSEMEKGLRCQFEGQLHDFHL